MEFERRCGLRARGGWNTVIDGSWDDWVALGIVPKDLAC